MSKIWTEDEKRIVREMYEDHFAAEIAQVVGKSASGVYRQAALMGLKCSKEKKARSGKIGSTDPKSIASRFQKGHTPKNKGKKIAPEVYEKIKDTMFKKGHAPVNYRPVGSERINVEGYVEVKVEDPNKWRLKQRLIWEKEMGPIPPGCNIQFRNGNRQDLRIENLYLISKAEQMKSENSVHARYPEELKQVMRIKAGLKRRITEYNKKQEKKYGKECESRDSEGASVRSSGRNKESQRS